MKTASRGTPSCRTHGSGNRAHGAEDQNRPCLHKRAAKQEKLQPLKWCFFLTPPFRELTRVSTLSKSQSIRLNRGPRLLEVRYDLQVVRVGQPEKVHRGDRHSFPRTEEH